MYIDVNIVGFKFTLTEITCLTSEYIHLYLYSEGKRCKINTLEHLHPLIDDSSTIWVFRTFCSYDKYCMKKKLLSNFIN